MEGKSWEKKRQRNLTGKRIKNRIRSRKKNVLQEELQRAFAAPKPQHREAFLRQLSERSLEIEQSVGTEQFLKTERSVSDTESAAWPGQWIDAGLPAFVLSQITYISKGIWWLSAAVFAAACLLAASPGMAGDRNQNQVIWGISALAPLLAMTVIAESGRSQSCQMAELEMATRFSLRSVALARLGILGLENLGMLILFVFMGRGGDGAGQGGSMVQAGLGILLPYLLTSFLGLRIVRSFRGREAVYYCFGMASCISILVFMTHDHIRYLYQERNLLWWAAGTFALGVGTVKQYVRLVGDTAELLCGSYNS